MTSSPRSRTEVAKRPTPSFLRNRTATFALALGFVGQTPSMPWLTDLVGQRQTSEARAFELAAKTRTSPEPREVEPTGRAIVTFTGFQQFDDQSSRIWVKLTRAVTIDVVAQPRRVSYRLKGTAVTTRNNMHPLLTKYFTSRITSVQVEHDDTDVVLSMDLSEPTTPQYKLHEEPGGGACFHIDFPPPTG